MGRRRVVRWVIDRWVHWVVDRGWGHMWVMDLGGHRPLGRVVGGRVGLFRWVMWAWQQVGPLGWVSGSWWWSVRADRWWRPGWWWRWSNHWRGRPPAHQDVVIVVIVIVVIRTQDANQIVVIVIVVQNIFIILA